MAKQKSDFKAPPWTCKTKYVDDNFILVTEENIKNAKVLGRVFYIWEVGEKISTFLGHIDLRPRLLPCKIKIENHPLKLNAEIIWIQQEESREEYAEFGKSILNYLKEKKLFIRPTDTLISYLKIT